MVSFDNIVGPITLRLLAKLATLQADSLPCVVVLFERTVAPVTVRLLAKTAALDDVSFP